MTLRSISFWGVWLAGGLAVAITGQAGTPEGVAGETAKDSAAAEVGPGPYDGRIAFVVGRLLEQVHYPTNAFDDEVSEKFFYRYLEALDPQHMHFLQSDVAEFGHYRTNLDNLTLRTTNGAGDPSPAFEIFHRFLERLGQRVAYADELLKTGKFEFSADERIALNRHEAPYPRDLAEARQLWRDRLRYDYLQEKLAREKPQDLLPKRAEAAPTPESARPAATRPVPAAVPSATNALAASLESGVTNEVARTPEAAKPAGEPQKKTMAEEITDLLSHRYRRNLRLFQEFDSADVMQIYLTALAHTYDPHSDYFNKSEADNFAIGMNLSLVGIGAELFTDENGYCTIRRLVEPGPALKSKKIKENDRIVAVAQGDAPPVDVVDMALNKVVQMIRGPKDTEVRLTLMPADNPSERRVVSLIRAPIKLEESEAKAQVIEWPDARGRALRLGVIDLPSFYAPIDANAAGQGDPKYTSVDVAALLKKMQAEKVDGVILDLRHNGGGSLEEAVKLTGLFIKSGPVVQVRMINNAVVEDDDKDSSMLYDGPLVVLTSRFSASASEIFAAALQDYGRALIVGDISTHGKGTVQQILPLSNWVTATNNPGELKLTIRKFYRASGVSTQLKGVMPDIVLPSVWNYSTDVGESALDNPLPCDSIPAAHYEKFNLVQPELAELLRRSTERVATNQDFNYVREDIEQFKKHQADKTISLNEQQRLREKQEADARQKARDSERRSRKASERIVHPLPLKMVNFPGLPPPEPRTNTVTAKGPGTKNGGAGSTRTASTGGTSTGLTAGPADNPEDEPPPAVDPTLEETENILVDYIALLSQNGMLTAGH